MLKSRNNLKLKDIIAIKRDLKSNSTQIPKLESFTLSLCLGLCLGLTACNIQVTPTPNGSVDSTEASVESGITILQGTADEQNNSGYAWQEKPKSIFLSMLQQTAVAGSCQRAVQNPCSSGVKSETYSSCTPSSSSMRMNGNVTLTYSNASCLMSNTGDSMTRTYDISISGPRGGTITHSSSTSTDYRGQSYGGGGQITKTASGFEVAILGRHNHLDYNGRQLMNTSVRSTSPLVMNQISRAGRIWSSGTIEVNHNLAKFTTTIQPNNVTWSSLCCHPISGSLNLSFSGSKSGTATVTFTGCGSAQLNDNGQTKNITLSYCE